MEKEKEAGLLRLKKVREKLLYTRHVLLFQKVMLALKQDLFIKTTICSGMKTIYGIFDSIPLHTYSLKNTIQFPF